MSISDAISLSRLVLVTDPRPAGDAEPVSVRRYRLARMPSEKPTPASPRSFEHLKRSHD